MNIRRDRTHQCGLTNLDFRTKGDFESLDRYQPSLKMTNFGTMGKSQYKRMVYTESVQEQAMITGGFKKQKKLDPKTETTADFYKGREKAQKNSVKIGKTKDNELEDEHWTDKVFTGDNPKLTAFLSMQARERGNLLIEENKNKRKLQSVEKEDLVQSDFNVKNKVDVHAEAEQET